MNNSNLNNTHQLNNTNQLNNASSAYNNIPPVSSNYSPSAWQTIGTSSGGHALLQQTTSNSVSSSAHSHQISTQGNVHFRTALYILMNNTERFTHEHFDFVFNNIHVEPFTDRVFFHDDLKMTDADKVALKLAIGGN